MKDVKVPALVLEGAETNVPLDATREWVKSLPNARLLLIPNAGHGNWIDQPEAVISAMHEFFRVAGLELRASVIYFGGGVAVSTPRICRAKAAGSS